MEPWWVISIGLSIHICKMGIVMPSCENASPTLYLQCKPSVSACLSFHILPFMLLLPPYMSRKEGTQRAFLKSTAVIKMSAKEEKDPVLLWWWWLRWMIYVQRNGYISSCYILKASCKTIWNIYLSGSTLWGIWFNQLLFLFSLEWSLATLVDSPTSVR